MGPVTVAILATLLPTCLLIFGLIFLSIYLCVKLRASRKEVKELRQLVPVEQEPWPRPLPVLESQYVLSDASNPNWVNDVLWWLWNLSSWGITVPYDRDFTTPGAKSWAEPIFDALGYQGASQALILQLIAKEQSRSQTILHVAASVALARTSIESEPESTLLPFSPEVRRDLQTFFKALEGIKFSPEFSNIISKIPSQIASVNGGINQKNLDKTMDRLMDLFLPVQEIRGFSRCTVDEISEAFNNIVTVRITMLGSRQRFEFRWSENTETTLCTMPALYSHAGEDGEPLAEPKLWCEAEILDFAALGNVFETIDV